MLSCNGLPLTCEHSCSGEKKSTVSAVYNVFLELALSAKGKYLSLAFV